MDSALQSIKKHFKHINLEIADIAAEMEPDVNGIVQSGVFNRFVETCGIPLEPGTLDAFHRAFDEGNGVNITKFVEAVEASGETAPAPDQKTIDNHLVDLYHQLSMMQFEMEYLLHPYDPTESGKVSPEDFIYAIGNTAAAHFVAENYTNKDDGMVHWKLVDRAMLRAVHNMPKAAEPPCLARVAHEIFVRHIQFRSFFFRNDRLQTGLLPQSVFTRTLGYFGIPMSPQEIEAITVYCKKGEMVDYIKFCDAVVSHNAKELLTRFRPSNSRVNVPLLIERIKSTANQRGIDITFSGTTGNLVSRANFIGQLQRLFSFMSDDDGNALADRFAVGRLDVDYAEFLARIKPSQEEIAFERLCAMLSQIRKDCRNRMDILKMHIKSFDPSNEGTIPASQLKDAFNRSGIQFSVHDLTTLYEAFRGDQVNDFDYVSFLKRIA